jgi:hypothetical protein
MATNPMVDAVRHQTWTAEDFKADKFHVPKPLNTLRCFKSFAELKATLVELRRNCRKRTAPKAPGPCNLPPPGFSTTTMPDQGTPAAIYDGVRWRTGVYIDTLPGRNKMSKGKREAAETTDENKGEADEKLPCRRLVVIVESPPTRAAKASTTAKASTKQKASAGKKKAASKRDPPKLKLVVCDFKDSFAGAERKEQA